MAMHDQQPHNHSICPKPHISPSGQNNKLSEMAASTMTTASSKPNETTTDDKDLNKDIAEMYDEGLFDDIWADQLHHGFYDPGEENETVSLASAQLRMIEEALRFAGLSGGGKKPERILDVGCGVGGSSRHFAKKYGSGTKTIGITISPGEVQKAQALSAAQGLSDQVSFHAADALNLAFPDGHFDMVWSLECSEHIPDKAKFVSELVRVAAPGGTIIIVASCHRDLGPDEKSLRTDETALLDEICKSFNLPEWCSAADYVNLLESHKVQDIKRADWSQNVTPFWPAVIRSVFEWKGITSFLQSGWKRIEFTLTMRLMIEGHMKDVIKYNIITCKKPE